MLKELGGKKKKLPRYYRSRSAPPMGNRPGFFSPAGFEAGAAELVAIMPGTIPKRAAGHIYNMASGRKLSSSPALLGNQELKSVQQSIKCG